MTSSSFDPARFRRLVAGLSLLLAPLFGLAWSLLVPPATGGVRGDVHFAAAHSMQWWAGTMLGGAFSFLLIPATLGLLHLARGRGAFAAHVAGAVVMAGAAYHGALLAFQLAETSVVQRLGDVAAIAPSLIDGPAFAVVLLPVTAMYVGLAALAVVLYLMGVVPLVTVITVVAALPVVFFGPAAFKARVCFALLVAGLGWAGVRLLRMEDDEWTERLIHPPSSRLTPRKIELAELHELLRKEIN